jgi:hypothetical protein
MPTTRGSDDPQPVVQLSPELVERLVSALEGMAIGQGVEAAAEFRTSLATETNAAIARWQTETLAVIADRFASLQPSNARTGDQLSLAQQQTVLTYEAFRTVVGRPGAASIVSAERSFNPKSRTHNVIVVAGPLPDTPLTLVAYGTTSAEIGRGQVTKGGRGNREAIIPDLKDNEPVARLEIHDQSDRPILLGPPIPAVTASVDHP